MKTHAPYGMEIADDCTTCPMRKEGFFCQMTTGILGGLPENEIYELVSEREPSCLSKGRCRVECTCCAKGA